MSRSFAASIAVAVIAMTAPAMAANSDRGFPLVEVARQQTHEEISAQVDEEMKQARDEAKLSRAMRGGLGEVEAAARESRIQAEVARAEATQAHFVAAVSARAGARGSGSCFGDFLKDVRNSGPVDESSLGIRAVDENGVTMATGTVFVVKDSAMPGETHNRILTANHVVNLADLDMLPDTLNGLRPLVKMLESDQTAGKPRSMLMKALPGLSAKEIDRFLDDVRTDPSKPDPVREARLRKALNLAPLSHFEIYSSSGKMVGIVRVVTKEALPGKVPQDNGIEVIRAADDWAVLALDLKASSPAQIAAFDRIPGLSLARVQASERTIGMSGDGTYPAVSPGFSGGPVVDSEGNVHALISAVKLIPGTVTARISNLVSPFKLSATESVVSAARVSDYLVLRQPLVTNPLGSPKLLAALGQAGMGVKVSYAAPLNSGIMLTPVGMPGGNCSASVTVQGHIGSPTRVVNRSLPSTPAPLEVRTSKNGTVMTYDNNGKLASAQLSNGDIRIYSDGQLISEHRGNGSIMEYENGKPVLLTNKNGTGVSYENGKALMKLAPDGTETLLTPGDRSSHSGGHQSRAPGMR